MTTTITHLLDDAALGGVTRFLDALKRQLGPSIVQQLVIASPGAKRQPCLDADLVVVHSTMNWSKLPWLMALRARRGRQPIVLVEHSYTGAFETNHVKKPVRFRAMLRMAYAIVDRVVAVSYGQAAWMRRTRLLPACKLAVIAPFTDCMMLATLPLPPTVRGPLRLGAYGRYCGQKDFSTLIAAMALVEADVATLSLRGFGPDGEHLRVQAAPLGHVHVGDKIDELSDFLAGIDALVVPSSYEPFGQVALEARLAGRPLIVTAVDGLPEQVEPGAGLVVPAGDPQALALAIRQMAAQRAASGWAEMSNAARTSALDHVTTSTLRWQALICELVPRVADDARPRRVA